jgi:hypothetical protein
MFLRVDASNIRFNPELTFGIVIYGAYGIRRVSHKKDGGYLSTLALPYWGLIGVGVLSAWFHLRLTYYSQMGMYLFGSHSFLCHCFIFACSSHLDHFPKGYTLQWVRLQSFFPMSESGRIVTHLRLTPARPPPLKCPH